MMLPMERSEVFRILADIFRRDDIKGKKLLHDTMMRESTGEPYDIDFWYEEQQILAGYLRIVNPPKDCVDGEYCFVYHSSSSQKDGNIAIDPFGNIRVYGDTLQSFIYRTIKDNSNLLAEYAKKLTQTYQHQVADTIVSVVKTYCETLMSEHASTFNQMDTFVTEGCCTDFLIRAINEPERNFQFGVVKHIYDHNIIGNDIWVRFSKPDDWLWTPIIIKPSIGDIIINTEQCVFTDIVGAKEIVRLARLISEQTGFAVSIRDWDGGSTREQNVSKYIKSLLQKHEMIDTVKKVLKEKDEEIGCDEVFQVVVDWLHAMSSCDRIKDIRNISYLHHTLSVSNSVGCGSSKQYVTEELKVSFTPYMKSMMISLGKEHIITIDYLGLGDITCVYIIKYNQRVIDDVLNKYLVACLAEVLKDRLGMDKLRAYTTVKCTHYTELTHCGPCFFNDDGMTAYVIDPNNVISNETINKNNKPNTILDMKAHIDSLVDKKLKKFVESGSMVYMTKDYLTDQILGQLKNDWQKDVYRSVYSSVWCTLAESQFKIAAYEFEKHFMEYVTLDNDECFTVRFGLQRINDNLPGIDIKFHERDEIHVRMIDHKDGAWSRPLIRFHGCESLIYFDTIRKTNCTYKEFISNVVSKIVLLEGLS